MTCQRYLIGGKKCGQETETKSVSTITHTSSPERKSSFLGKKETRYISSQNKMSNTRSKHWCFTINNPPENNIPGTWSNIKYAVWQLEKGESLTPHLQGYVSFTNEPARKSLQKMAPGTHWTVALGTAKQNTVYCTKKDTRVEGPWFKGAMAQGKRTDMDRLKKDVLSGMSLAKLATQHFTSMVRYSKGIQYIRWLRQIHRSHDETTYGLVLYGAPGTGKSYTAAALAGPNVYVKPAGKWWDGYEQQKVVILEEFYGFLSPHTVQRLLDHGPLNLEIKGGHVKFNSREVIFTCNDHPSTWWPNATISNDVRQALGRRFKYFMYFPSPGRHEFEEPNFFGRPQNYAMFGNREPQ